MRAAELMRRPVLTCSVGDAAAVAARLMWEHDVGTVLVVDAEGRLSGIVTDRDLCMAVYTMRKTLDAIPVTIAMAIEVETCRPESTVKEVERRLRSRKVRRLPVVDREGRPVGMLSLDDLVRAAARRRRASSRPAREFVRTMDTICRWRRPGERIVIATPADDESRGSP
jgi:CBS domain-containing protein